MFDGGVGRGTVPLLFGGLFVVAGGFGTLGDTGAWGVEGPALVSARAGNAALSMATAETAKSSLIAQILGRCFIKQRTAARWRS
jgi:hypothetical protein